MMVTPILQQAYFPLNENLQQIIFSYLSCKDLSNLAQTNKQIYFSIKEHCNCYWKRDCINYFCSSYEKNRIINLDYSKMQMLMFEKTDNKTYEMINDLTDDISFNWKECFQLGITLQLKWNAFINENANEFKEDIRELKDIVYFYLQDFSGVPRLRKENLYVENDINTEFQLALYEVLLNEKSLEEDYAEYFNISRNIKIKSNDSDCSMMSINDIFFSSLIDNFQLFIQQLQINQDILNEFCELRWYKYTNINELNCNYSNNIIISMLKLLINTLKHFCLVAYNHLLSQSKNDDYEEYCQQYVMWYKNYVETAIELNEKYKYINLIINTLYDHFRGKYLQNNLIKPNFSILRLFMVIWNNEVTLKLLSITMDNIKKLFNCIVDSDLNAVSINLSNQIGSNNFLFSSTSYTKTNYNNGNVNEYSFSERKTASTLDQGELSPPLKCELSSSASYYFYYSLNSYQPKSNEDIIKRELLSKIISYLNDTFCNECNIFTINLSTNNETNDIYDLIETSLCKILKDKITNFYYQLKNKSNNTTLTHKQISDEIISYYNMSSFYNEKFINKLRLNLYFTIYKTIEHILFAYITNQFINEYVSTKAYKKISPIFANSFLEHFSIEEFRNENVFNPLLGCLVGTDIEEQVKVYMVVSFIQLHRKERDNLIVIGESMNSWFIGEEGKMMVKNKRVNKEVKRRNAEFNFNEIQRRLFSYIFTTSFDEIKLIEENNSQHININTNFEQSDIEMSNFN